MNLDQIIALVGLCSFPIYITYREAISGAKYATALAATEVSVLVLFAITAILTQETESWLIYVYAVLLLLSFWRLFELRDLSHVPMPLSAVAWVLGTALVVGIIFVCISLNRYAFIRGNDEYQVQVYDRFTGKRHY